MGRWVAGLRVRLGRKPLGVFVLRESAARGDRLDRLQGIRDRKRISFYFFLCRRSRRSPLRAIFLSTLPEFCSWCLVVRKDKTMCIFVYFWGRPLEHFGRSQVWISLIWDEKSRFGECLDSPGDCPPGTEAILIRISLCFAICCRGLSQIVGFRSEFWNILGGLRC